MQRCSSKKLSRMSKHTVLGFLDECSLQTTANTQRMWSFDHSPLVKNTEKIRANTFGIFAVNGTSLVTFRERSKQEDIREVLKEYMRANPNKRLVIVLDNFKSHHATLVRQYAAGNNIHLVHLPHLSCHPSPAFEVRAEGPAAYRAG